VTNENINITNVIDNSLEYTRELNADDINKHNFKQLMRLGSDEIDLDRDEEVRAELSDDNHDEDILDSPEKI
jgi:hypothetical protein